MYSLSPFIIVINTGSLNPKNKSFTLLVSKIFLCTYLLPPPPPCAHIHTHRSTAELELEKKIRFKDFEPDPFG